MKFSFGDTTIGITHADSAALLREIGARLDSGRGFAVATLNLDHLVKLRRSATFRAAYAQQDMVVADGNPVVWLSRLAGQPVALVPGSDMVLPVAAAAAAAGRPLALVGSTADSLERAAEAMERAVPGLVVAARISPPMGFDPDSDEAEAILTGLAAQGVGLVFVALGAPKQECFAARGRTLAPGMGFVSIGAGLDFLSGKQQRAPRWMRLLALEWLWRALGDPARMVPRYAACAAILPGETLAALRQRR